MFEVGVLCDNCHNNKSVKLWHTGHSLCEECYNEWDRKNKNIQMTVNDFLPDKQNSINKFF